MPTAGLNSLALRFGGFGHGGGGVGLVVLFVLLAVVMHWVMSSSGAE